MQKEGMHPGLLCGSGHCQEPPSPSKHLPSHKAPGDCMWLTHIRLETTKLPGESLWPQENLPGARLMASWQAEPRGRSTSCWQPTTASLPPINASALCYSERKRPEICFYNTLLAFHGGIKRESTSRTTYACKITAYIPPEQSGAREQVLCKRLKCSWNLRAATLASSLVRGSA